MAESREKLDITAVEEMIRRGMPVLDAPDSISPEAVAKHLEENRKIRRTPIYVFVRTAVAAVLVIAIGIGARYAAGSRKKEAAYEEMMSETKTGETEFYYKTDDEPSFAPDSDSDGLGRDVYEEEFPSEASGVINGAQQSGSAMTLILRPGEESVIDTDVPYTDKLTVQPMVSAVSEDSETEICETEVRNGGDGMAEICVRALEQGSMVLELADGNGVVLTVKITVEE